MTVTQQGHVLGAELEQCPQCRTRASFGTSLEVASGQDEHCDGRGDLEIDLVGSTLSGEPHEVHPHAGLTGSAEEQGIQRPQVGGAHSHRDQCVHRRGTVAKVHQCGPMERPGAPDHDRACQRQAEPLPVVELQRRHHGQHDHRDRQDQRDEQPLPQRRYFVHPLCGTTLPPIGIGARVRSILRGVVAGRLHCRDRVSRHGPFGQFHLGLLRGEVDRGTHTGHPVELLLDPCRTGGTGHSLDVEVNGTTHCLTSTRSAQLNNHPIR